MKKIGILTLYEGNYNFGGILQAYALCEKINSLGGECRVISYIDSYNPVYPTLKLQLAQYGFKEIIKKSWEKFLTKLATKEFKEIYSKRKEKFELFKNKEIPHTKIVKYDDLQEILSEFDILISGSDQVWNPNCTRKGFLQIFEKDNNIIKAAYAASISRNQLSDFEKKVIIPAIKDFDYIGVREETAKKILETDIEKNIVVTLDPTLLLSKKEWEDVTDNRIIQEEYILCYFFSDCKKYIKDIKKLSKQKELKIIYIPYAKQEYNTIDKKWKKCFVDNIGPKEFLSLFKNARYVFTDSFHGAVFSLIYEKNFIIFERSKNTKVSMNSRLYDLLNKFDLSDRMVNNDIKIELIYNKEIDYNKVNNNIEKYKSISIDYLKNIIDNKGEKNDK